MGWVKLHRSSGTDARCGISNADVQGRKFYKGRGDDHHNLESWIQSLLMGSTPRFRHTERRFLGGCLGRLSADIFARVVYVTVPWHMRCEFLVCQSRMLTTCVGRWNPSTVAVREGMSSCSCRQDRKPKQPGVKIPTLVIERLHLEMTLHKFGKKRWHVRGRKGQRRSRPFPCSRSYFVGRTEEQRMVGFLQISGVAWAVALVSLAFRIVPWSTCAHKLCSMR